MSLRKRRHDRWIEDHDRPGGVGRAERGRAFWVRVASGRPAAAPCHAPRRSERRHAGGASNEPVNDPSEEFANTERESDWESLRVALVTLLSIVVFGLGWTSLELDRLIAVSSAASATQYDGMLGMPLIADDLGSHPAVAHPNSSDVSDMSDTSETSAVSEM